VSRFIAIAPQAAAPCGDSGVAMLVHTLRGQPSERRPGLGLAPSPGVVTRRNLPGDRVARGQRLRELEIARADLVAAMDPELVARSEWSQGGATNHFLVVA
jgi:hypothetical protein